MQTDTPTDHAALAPAAAPEPDAPFGEDPPKPAPPRRILGHRTPFDNTKPWQPLRLFRLVTAPKRFFAEDLDGLPDMAVIFAVVVVGVGLVVQRMAEAADSAFVNARVTGKPLPADAEMTWLAFWATAAVGGAVGGGLRYLIGGWWYRVRVNWSGDWNAHPEYAKVVFIHSELVWAVPAALVALYQTCAYPSPAAVAGQSMLGLVVVPALLWSYYCSFRGVTESFDVSTPKAAALFLVLPAFLTCSAFIVGVVYAVFNLATIAPK